MLRALHHALGLVQNTQWATVGHVVAAAAAQAQASDDAARILSLVCATDFLFIFIGPPCYIISWFFHSCLFCPSFFVLFIPLRFALILLSPLSSRPLVPPSSLSLISVFVYISGARRMHLARITPQISDLSAPNPYVLARDKMLITCSGRTGARSAYYRPLLFCFHQWWTDGAYSITPTSGFLFGKPPWGLRPLRGQCWDQWGSIWG